MRFFYTVTNCIRSVWRDNLSRPVGRGLAPAVENYLCKITDCHSEPCFLRLLTKNLYAKVTFEILRGSVFAGKTQNDTSYPALNIVYSYKLYMLRMAR